MRPSCCGEPMLNVSPRSCVDLALQALDVGVDARAQIDQRGRIERDAGAFDLGQHDRQRDLDVGVERELVARLELGARDVREPAGGVGGGRGVFGQRAAQQRRRRLRDVGVGARRIEQVRARSSDRRRSRAAAGRARRSRAFAS